jgi:glycosyltransferase involved in cell wall biosynthesis
MGASVTGQLRSAGAVSPRSQANLRSQASDEPTSILIIHTWNSWGGGERYVLNIATHLRQNGMRVGVASSFAPLRRALHEAHIAVWTLPIAPVRFRRWAWRLTIALTPVLLLQYFVIMVRARSFGQIHIVTFEDQLLATWVGLLLGRRVSWSVHGVTALKPDATQHRLLSVLSRRVACILVPANAVKQALVDHGVASDMIRVIPNGIDTDVGEGARHHVTQQAPCVLFVGRLDEMKDPLFFIAVAREVLNRRSEVTFRLVGDGPLRDDCRDAVGQAGLEGRVVLCGHVDAVHDEYRRADLLALTSRSEAFPTVLLEASAHALPVVAVDVGGVGEIVVDGVTGRLCPRRVSAVAECIVAFLEDDETRRRMGLAAKSRARELFSVEKMCQRTEAVFRSIARESANLRS